MRIAFTPAARLLSETEPNGEALIAVSLLRALAARGHDVLAYCERADVAIDGVEIREISAHAPSVALGRIAFARRIARDVARERIDVVHALFPLTTADGYTLAANAPLVCGPMNVPWPSIPRARRPLQRVAAYATDPVERALHDRTLARAACLLVTGDSSRTAIPATLRDRCVELPFGVDLSRFNATTLPDEPVIVFLSVLSERKGIETLVRAMPAVRARVPRARLIVAGPDPTGLRARLVQIAKDLSVADAIEFAGPVAAAEAPAWYARARVFCQPSVGEPFGMTVIEAMASGRPVVATRAGGIPDALADGEGGFLVRPGDVEALAEALAAVLAHGQEAARMGALNRHRVEERYALDVVVDRLERVYADVKGRVHVPTA